MITHKKLIAFRIWYKKLGRNFRIIAIAQDGVIEAIIHKKHKWLGWMWHPEREKKFNKKLIKIAKNFFIS